MSSAVLTSATSFDCLGSTLSGHLGLLARVSEERSQSTPAAEASEQWVHVDPAHLRVSWASLVPIVEMLERRLCSAVVLTVSRRQEIAHEMWQVLRDNLENPEIFPGMVIGVFFRARRGADRSPGEVSVHYYCGQPV